MERKTILLRILLPLIIVLLASYLVYRDISKTVPTDGGDSNASSTVVSVPASVTSNPSEVVKVVPSKGDDDLVLKGSIPSLDKKWVYPQSYTEETKQIIETRVATIEQSLKENPKQYDKWVELGTFRKLINDYVEAGAIWEFAARNWPESFVSYHNLGDLYHFYLKDYTKAETNMLKVIELAPNYISEYSLLHDLYSRLYGVGDKRTVGILLKGLENNPFSPDLMVAVAGNYKEVGNSAEAKKYYEMALSRAKELGNTSLQQLIELELQKL